MSHYEERLERDLQRIRDSIREIAGMVEVALRDSMRALLEGNAPLANLTVLTDNRINRASRRIDRLCHAFIARHLPGAGHLRLISAVIRLNVALERVGDYAVTISRESLQLTTPPQALLARELERVSGESRRLLTQAVEGFVDENAEMAAASIRATEHIENMMDDIYAELTGAPSTRSPREIVAAFVVFSLLKRISDQAKNISEQTLFAVAGARKRTRPFNIMFIDDGNNERSLIAQAIARKSFADAGNFSSAAKAPNSAPDPALIAFLDDSGVETEGLTVQTAGDARQHLQETHIAIGLSGPVEALVGPVPFHTTAIEWDVEAMLGQHAPEGDDARRQAIYRYIRQQLDELMALISGEGDEHD